MNKRTVRGATQSREQRTPVYDFGETEKSGPADASWDKYYFFSDPASKTVVHKTARLGRSRPAALGPQTFLMQSWSADDLRKLVEEDTSSKDRTVYNESFSQLQRTSRALSAAQLPPIDPARSLISAHVPGSPNKNYKEEMAAKAMEESAAGSKTAATPGGGMTPHIFPNGHVTSDQLFAQDRRSPANFCYTGGMSMAFR